MAMGQSAYENASNSVARSGMKTGDAGFLAKGIGKGLSAAGGQFKTWSGMAKKAEAAQAKEEKLAQKEAKKAAAKRSESATKAAATRKANAAPKPGRMSGSKGIDTRPSGLPTIKPVVLNRTQHFESAVGNAKDTSASRAATPKLDYSAAEAYND